MHALFGFFVALALLIPAFPTSAQTDEDEPSPAVVKELKALEGSWQLKSMVDSGADQDKADFEGLVTTIRSGVLTAITKSGNILVKAELKVDPAKTPKVLDLMVLEGPNKGKTFPGIFKLDKDQLTICHVPPGKERPKTFASTASSSASLMVYRREGAGELAGKDKDNGKEPKDTAKTKEPAPKDPPAKASGDKAGWEFRVLSKEEVLALGKDDLSAGLHYLGQGGWHLGGIEPGKNASTTWMYFQRSTAPPAAAPTNPSPIVAPKTNPKASFKTFPPDDAKTVVSVLGLKHADGILLSKTLHELLEGKDNPGLRITVDQRTNSILVRGAPAQVDLVRDLVEQLDVAVENVKKRLEE